MIVADFRYIIPTFVVGQLHTFYQLAIFSLKTAALDYLEIWKNQIKLKTNYNEKKSIFKHKESITKCNYFTNLRKMFIKFIFRRVKP